jgi:hypothetical protein
MSIDRRSREDQLEDSQQSPFAKWLGRSVLFASLSVFALYAFCIVFVGKNDLHTWQVLQYPSGNVEVRNRPGWYFTWGARISTYPCMLQVYGTKNNIPQSPGDDSVHVQFNDGGSADISWVARVDTPCPVSPFAEEDPALTIRQKEFHRQFKGNVKSAEEAVRSAVRQIIPQTGPMMSSTENQAARKGEFWKLIHDQLKEGLYKTKPVELKADTGLAKMLEAMEKPGDVKPVENDPKAPALPATGPKRGTKASPLFTEHAITTTDTVVAAEVVLDAKTGKPVISSPSPLKQYDMVVLQFSIIATDYDSETLSKFADKKKLYLEAERSKAAAIENIQKRFQRVAQGEREVAESEWIAEQTRTRERIKAETGEELAKISKETKRIESETLSLVAVVEKDKEDLLQQIASEKVKIAENGKTAAEVVAKARELQIEKAGAISDHEKQLGEIAVEEAELIAKALMNFKGPDIVILSPDAIDHSKGTAMEQALPSLQFMRAFGLLDDKTKGLNIPPRTPVVNKVALPAKAVEVDVAAGK